MRVVWLLSIVLALNATSTHATNIWISPSGTSSAPPADPSEIPVLGPSGTAYVWARPDPEQTLLNWELNIHADNPGVINLTRVDVLNPLLGQLTSGTIYLYILRYEFISEPAPASDGQSIMSFQGYTVDNTTAVGAGLGPNSIPFDPYYDSVNDSWLIAEITYRSIGRGMTGLYLQHQGLNNLGQGASDTEVVFGTLTDPGLNGVSGRNMDSATPDAHIIVPEPSTLLCFGTGCMALSSRLTRRRIGAARRERSGRTSAARGGVGFRHRLPVFVRHDALERQKYPRSSTFFVSRVQDGSRPLT
jgi:hypothetical protein